MRTLQPQIQQQNMKGIIFDIDGTLVDNMMVHHRAWQQKLRELGLDYSLAQVKEEIHGINMEILERLFGDRFTWEERAQIAWEKEAAYREIYASEIAPLPGLLDFLEAASALNIPMSVATAGPPENCHFVLEQLGIAPFFSHVVHAQMVSRGKPHPEAFEQAAAGMGLALKDCLVFEDSVTGAAAAANGHCPAVVITTTHAQEEFDHFDHILFFAAHFQGIQLRLLEQGRFAISSPPEN